MRYTTTMSWTEVTTKQFTMPIDFGGIISYGIAENDVVLDGLKTKVAGKNYMGFYIAKILSVDNIGIPYIHSANEIIVTPLITFTAECIRLTPQRIIADIVMGDKNIGKRMLNENGSEISVIYTDKGAEFQAGTIWPTVISSVTHSAYSSKIVVTGEVLVPKSPSFYSHDGSNAPSTRFMISPIQPSSDKVAGIYTKLRGIYEISGMPGAVLSGDPSFEENAIYTLAGPIGPIHKLNVGDEFGGMTWADIKAAASKVNMYDIHAMTVDAKNAVLYIAEQYDIEDRKKLVGPYLMYVRNEMRRIKQTM